MTEQVSMHICVQQCTHYNPLDPHGNDDAGLLNQVFSSKWIHYYGIKSKNYSSSFESLSQIQINPKPPSRLTNLNFYFLNFPVF